MHYPHIEVILLAAGHSKRMGTANKLLVDWQGEPLIRRSAARYCALGMPVNIILGHEADAVKAALNGLPVSTTLNQAHMTGQQSSILAGLSAAKAQGDGVMMALGDQPLLQTDDIAALCEAFLQSDKTCIVLPQYKGQRGNPVLLPALIARRLKDAQALPRAYMDQHPDAVHIFEAANTHFTTDLDTPEDLARLQSKF